MKLEMGKIMEQDTIVGVASGMGGGIGIIRLSGMDALSLAGKVFRTKKHVGQEQMADSFWNEDYFRQQETHTIHYGFIVEENGAVIDEVMVLLMKSPRSYTMEDVVEIDSHGGPFLLQKILKLLIRLGARLAEPGEFTKRAFLNGRIDLAQAESVMKMISSKSDFALKSAVNQLEGRVSEHIGKVRKEILYYMGKIESALDDPEHYSLDGFSEEFMEILEKEIATLRDLVENFEQGRMKSEGIYTVIVGKPNAGKSSLMNLLLDEERAIVTSVAGTTRDVLEETVHLGSLILNVVDTAGIHDTEDIVETLGVEKAKEFLARADFIIYVVDVTDSFNEGDEKILSLLGEKKGIILFNKVDLQETWQEKEWRERLPWKSISFSSKTGEGLNQLERYISDAFCQEDISFNDQIYLTSVRHLEAVENAYHSLEAVVQTIRDGMPEDLYMVDLMDAYRNLGLINGETASEDLVNKIFSEFCMGK